ncbi:MAG: HlyD family efflux transporter periplasmic adaptor subunit [Prochloraceae cyanobacterium]|nr:HlyD family efflux transporter periplasmic adaptor subunit [Prochloraceae cyanobacterium]
MQLKQNPSKIFNYWLIGAISLLSVGTLIAYTNLPKSKQQPSTMVSAESAPVKNVVAIGRIEPKGSVIKLSVANAQDSRVNQLLVKEGDYVKAGQLIATLQGIEKKEAAIIEAQKNVAVFRAKLTQAQIGSTTASNVAAQKAAVEKLEAQLQTTKAEKQAAIERVRAELRNDRAEYERYEKLYREGAISASDRDSRRRNLDTTRAQLQEARAQLNNTERTLKAQIQQERAKLKQLSAVRPVDVQIGRAELDYAISQLARAKAELEDFYVRVPVSGQILKVNTHVGERVNSEEGIVDLGQTEQMYAIAEVYETDAFKVKVGQKATIKSENGGLPDQLKGTVEEIGLQIKKTDVLNTDPAADDNARVVEVKILLDPEDSKKVTRLTYMQVRAEIQVN